MAHRLLRAAILPKDTKAITTKGLGFWIRDFYKSLLHISIIFPFFFLFLLLFHLFLTLMFSFSSTMWTILSGF